MPASVERRLEVERYVARLFRCLNQVRHRRLLFTGIDLKLVLRERQVAQVNDVDTCVVCTLSPLSE